MRMSRIVFAALALALIACSGGSSGSQADESFATPRADQIFIEVDNQNFDRATVWYQTSGNRRRVGVVEGKTSQTFTIDNWRIAAPIQVEIVLTAGGRCITPELQADPGDNLYLQVPVGGVLSSC